MIKTLLGAQLSLLFSQFSGKRRAAKNSKANSASTAKLILFGILFAFIGLCFAVMFAGFGLGLAELLLDGSEAGVVSYVSFFGLAAFVLCFIGSVFSCEKQLYEAPDNEMLLSMPIPARAILLCRMLSLYLINLIFAAIALIPGFAVLFGYIGFSATALLSLLLSVLLIPLLSLAVTAIIGAAVAFLASRLPFKNLVTTVVFILFFLAYMYFYMNLDTFLQAFANEGATIASAIPPLSALGLFCVGKIGYAFLFALWCLVPFGLVYWILSVSFFTIVSANRGERRVKYREKAMKTSSALSALTKKELTRFFSMPMYILNCSLGTVGQLIVVILLAVKREMLNDFLLQAEGMMADLPIKIELPALIALGLCAISCLCISFNYISAPSISLEGSRIWQIKVMPVRTRDVMTAKLLCHVIVSAPMTIVFAIASVVLFRCSLLSGLLIALVPLFMSASFAAWGLCCNLWLPRLDFPSDIHAVKQSGTVFLALFGGMLLYDLPLLGFALLGAVLSSSALFAVMMCGYAVITGAIFSTYIFTGGKKKFETKIGM